jgi:Flp pilus assembly protein TadD
MGPGNAWRDAVCVRIRQGNTQQGVADLLVAAALEPNRAVLRSYLGKAFDETRDFKRADAELGRAKELDPNDPTAWCILRY